MKFMDFDRKTFSFLIAFFFVSLFFRSIFLTTTPALISHDEMYYAVEAQSLAISGKDISGTWTPLKLKPAHVLYAELPGTLMTPAALVFSHPLVKARAMHILIGTLFPFVLAALVWTISQKKELSIITLIFASFNPWVFQFSRMNFDALFSLFFYFLGILVLFRTTGWKRLYAMIPFFLGFFQYQGLKIIFVPMIVILSGYFIWQEYKPPFKKNISAQYPMLSVLVISLAILGFYLMRLPSQSASNRLNDLIFFNNEYLSKIVNTDRRLSIDSKLSSIFVNKGTVMVSEILNKYSKAFDPGFLFMYGEPVRNPFSVWSMGIFHRVDFFLVLIGMVMIWQKKQWRKVAVLLTGLILISPIPVSINTIDSWIMFRASFLFPLLIVLSAIGFYSLWSYPSVWSKGVLISVYAVSLIWFGYQYFYRYPVYSTTGEYFAERVYSNYIKRLPANKKVTILVKESRFAFESYLYYNNLITTENLPEINKAIQSGDHVLGNVRFDTDCIDLRDLGSDSIVISDAINTECPESEKAKKPEMKMTAIPSLIDSGAVYRVYNDTFCSQYNLQGYSRVQTRKVLDVEQNTDEDFCKNLFVY